MENTFLDIDRYFTYHKPVGSQPQRYESIREMGKDLARVIKSECPPSPESTIAIRKVQEAVMWANASIAINERIEDEDSSSKSSTPIPRYEGTDSRVGNRLEHAVGRDRD